MHASQITQGRGTSVAGFHWYQSRRGQDLTWENAMRTIKASIFAVIGAAALAGSGASVAAPVGAGAIGQAAETIGLSESVHCRQFRHWHRWGYSRGCDRVYFDEGVRVRTRIGVHERHGVRSRLGEREGFRGESRTGVTVRGSESRDGFREGAGGESRRGVNARGSESRSGVGVGGSVRGGNTAGDASPRGSTGTGGSVGSPDGTMNSAPTGGGSSGAGTGAGGSQGNRQ
jgi:hypothetical protein